MYEELRRLGNSLMILLTIIAVGLLTLSSISLRASSQSADMATARSNALMALMLAMGELQKQAGPDTRVTARADNSCAIPKGVAANFRASKSILYPWTEYRGSAADRTIYQHGAVASCENLKDYAFLYQNSSPFSLITRSVRNDSTYPGGC